MNCSSMLCKKAIDDDSTFCKFCGAKQAFRPKTAAPAPATAAAPAAAPVSMNAKEIPHAAPPHFDAAPVAAAVTLPPNPTPATDFFLYAGTLKIYKGNSDVVVVPPEVTSIGAGVFRDHLNLREVYLPDTVTSISSEAFSGCTNLSKINLPEGLTSIGPKAFYSCTSLETVVLPRSMQRILDRAFENCTSLKEIYIPDSVTTLSYFAFSHCVSLWKVKLPNMIVAVAEGLFQGCVSLKGIELPDGLKNIEKHAFDQAGLEYITIPLTTINIEEQAFARMPNLCGITVPKITKIDNYAFVETNLINKGSIRYVM